MRNAETALTKRVRIEYSDQNEAVAPLFPRSGVVRHTHTDAHVNRGWHRLELDEPFEYQLKVGEPFRSQVVHVSHLLVRSRWAGHEVGDGEPTSVFVLLVPDTQLPVPEPLNPASYHQLAWGSAVAEA